MDRVFYKSFVDVGTNYPVYIFDTSFLPQPDEIDYDELIITLITLLPNHRYILVMFNCGLNHINWLWGLKFLKKFLINDHNNLYQLISVHDSWFIKSLTLLLVNYSWKNSLQFIHCQNLSQLNHQLPVKNLKISLNIWKYDNSSLILNKKISDNDLLYHIYQLFNIIDQNLKKIPIIFLKPGNKVNSMILFNCIVSSQLFFINDWDLLSIVSVFKKLLSNLKYPLIPLWLIDSSNSFDDIINYHKKIGRGYDALLYRLFTFFDKVLITDSNHSSTTLAKCLASCLGQVGNKDMPVMINYISSIIDNWEKISRSYTYQTDELINYQSVDNNYDLQINDLLLSSSNSNPPSKPVETNTNEFMHEKVDINKGELDLGENLIDLSIDDPTQEIEQLTSYEPLDDKPPPKDQSILQESSIQSLPSNSYLQLRSSQPALNQKYKQLTDVSNITFGNQKYTIPKTKTKPEKPKPIQDIVQAKKPVIRGRKVGELAKLFEERSQGYEILRTM